MSRLFKSNCYFCSAEIEFPEEKVGHKIVCPHCGEETKLGRNPFAKPWPERSASTSNSADSFHPATEDQLQELRLLLKHDGETPEDYAEEGEQLSYDLVKDLIRQCRIDEKKRLELEAEGPPSREQRTALKELGFRLDTRVEICKWEIEFLLQFRGKPPREQDVELLKQHGIAFFEGDGLAAFALASLIAHFEDMSPRETARFKNLLVACKAAASDPAFQTPTVTHDAELRMLSFTWPKRKLREWFRHGAD